MWAASWTGPVVICMSRLLGSLRPRTGGPSSGRHWLRASLPVHECSDVPRAADASPAGVARLISYG
jgi:hypothetical protein